MNGLEQGLQNMGELLSYVGLIVLVLAIGLAASPLLLWWNSAKNTRLLRALLEEQERTNELLEKLTVSPDNPAPPDFLFDKDE